MDLDVCLVTKMKLDFFGLLTLPLSKVVEKDKISDFYVQWEIYFILYGNRYTFGFLTF